MPQQNENDAIGSLTIDPGPTTVTARTSSSVILLASIRTSRRSSRRRVGASCCPTCKPTGRTTKVMTRASGSTSGTSTVRLCRSDNSDQTLTMIQALASTPSSPTATATTSPRKKSVIISRRLSIFSRASIRTRYASDFEVLLYRG
jgi:hypothetical protein